MQRVLVTGGAGMIGRRVVAALLHQGREVAVLDNLSVGLPMPVASRCVQGDVRDEATLRELFAAFRPQAVMHLAAIHHIPACEQLRATCLEVNVVGTERVLQQCADAAVGRVVLASSGAVYDWKDGPLCENDATFARDNYALSKLSNESQLRFWSERTALSGRVARIFNTIAHDDPNGHLIPDVLTQLRAPDSTGVCLGNLSPRRDYLHADDVAAGLLSLLDDTRDVGFDTFNLCSGVEHSVLELVHMLATVLGRDVRVVESEARKRRVDRPSQWGDPGKTLSTLKWRHTLGFAEALQRTVLV